MFVNRGAFIFHLLLYFLLSILIIQYKISAMMCFLLRFNVMFYILSNEYPTLKIFILHSTLVIATLHTDIVTHTSDTFSLGLVTYQLNIL